MIGIVKVWINSRDNFQFINCLVNWTKLSKKIGGMEKIVLIAGVKEWTKKH